MLLIYVENFTAERGFTGDVSHSRKAKFSVAFRGTLPEAIKALKDHSRNFAEFSKDSRTDGRWMVSEYKVLMVSQIETLLPEELDAAGIWELKQPTAMAA